MTTTAHLVVFTRKNNENADTAMYPHCVWTEGCVDLTATGSFCINSGWDAQVSAALYETRTVVIPTWMSIDEWMRDNIGWRYTWSYGVEKEWPEHVQRFCRMLGCGPRRMAVVKLYRTKAFRSAFRGSLKERLIAWLDETAHTLESPFSQRQWDALCDVYTRKEARGVDNSTYYNR